MDDNNENGTSKAGMVKPKLEAEFVNGSWWVDAPPGYVWHTMEGKTQPHMLLLEASE